MTRETRIVLEAGDNIRMRVIWPRCEAESVYPLGDVSPRLHLDCEHCMNQHLENEEIKVVNGVIYALRQAKRMQERENAALLQASLRESQPEPS